MYSRNAQNSYQLHKRVLVKKTDTFLLLFQIQIKITGFESPFRKRFSKAFLGRSVDERSEFAPQATSEVCTLAMHRIVISSIKGYWLKRLIPFIVV
jgi:hypothetical protein